MRIGIDARELTGHPTGVGRYLSGLLNRWATSVGDAHEWVLYAHRHVPNVPERFAVRVIPGAGGSAWEQATLPLHIRRDGVGAFFSPGYTAPMFAGVPVTVAVHDVSYFAHPEWFSPREGARRRFLSRRTAADAAAVVTISEFSKQEIVAHMRIPAARVRVIPPGIDLPAGATASPAVPSRDARILFVGSIFNRRNIPQLVDATRRVIERHPEVSLDLVGDNRSRPPIDLSAFTNHGGSIRWHQYVPDAELLALYASSRAFAFLSEYEGLGLTPLEALTMGVPPVLLDTPVARESCGDAALYVRHGDIEGTADALAAVLFDEPTRERLLGAAPAVLTRYDWTRAAEDTLAAILRA